MSQSPPFTNRLIHETSPYLRQHAHNPVDWYAWGPEALERARELDRPIFLSIGYSACHWCHVMEHESFEDPEVGQLLNDHFVSIKVDREERPDLDQIYMNAVQYLTQLMTGQAQGGWPMSMFLTPDLKPFWGGTYFPPEDHYGRPGFKRVLTQIAEWWEKNREKIAQQAEQITEYLQGSDRLEPAPGDLTPELLRKAAQQLSRYFDSQNGGFGSEPKFPHPMELRLLLRSWKRFGDDHALQMAQLTLDKMAMGGIYDHLGGGFHRYSTDRRWLVPHFEKMLYDNALLSVAYLEAWQATGEPFYREVVAETLGYVQREMTSPEGPFYSTQDADSEGVEGKFYVWSAKEVEEVLGKDLEPVFTDTFTYVYDVTPEGNWEEQNILHRGRTYQQNARLLDLPETELRRILNEAKRRLLEVRSKRIWPGRDEKVLTSWNGLMIAAFARAAQGLDQPAYAAIAAKAADFILTRMHTAEGRLLRTWSAGSSAKLNAYLEDYSYLIDALVSLYEADFNPRWTEEAIHLAEVMIDQFWDAEEGGFFFTGRDHEELITRTKDSQDNATPSGNSMAVFGLLRLARLTGRGDFLEKAEKTLQLHRGLMENHPMAAGQMLVALDFYAGPVKEIAIVGDPDQEETQRVLRTVRSGFRPNQVTAFRSSKDRNAKVEQTIPLLAGKEEKGTVTTYLCENFACRAPLVGAGAVEETLKQ